MGVHLGYIKPATAVGQCERPFGSVVTSPRVKQSYYPHTIHVWYVYEWLISYGKYKQIIMICDKWMLWALILNFNMTSTLHASWGAQHLCIFASTFAPVLSLERNEYRPKDVFLAQEIPRQKNKDDPWDHNNTLTISWTSWMIR